MELTKNWFVAYTYPRSEKKVHSSILAQNFESFLPLRTVRKQWSDRVKLIEEPLFSNYVFVNTTVENLPRLSDIYGVARFISFGKKFATVRENEIKLIKNIIKQDIDIQSEDEAWVKGQRVRVESGPFVNLEGQLVKRQGKHRFIVMLEGLKKSFSMEIPTQFLKPIS